MYVFYIKRHASQTTPCTDKKPCEEVCESKFAPSAAVLEPDCVCVSIPKAFFIQ